MEEKFISLSRENIDEEHICCAFSDKKCAEGYSLKKEWLKREFENEYTFVRLDERAKVFIEYGPAEKAWTPIDAPNYIMINCFWVSGKYKGNGYGKKLLKQALDDAVKKRKYGLVTVAGVNKFHFMSNTKWLIKHGFEIVEQLPSGFCLLVLKCQSQAPSPSFKPHLKGIEPGETQKGLVAYYSDRCPYAQYYVQGELPFTAEKRGLQLEINHLQTREEAQGAPIPATIFSLFYNGKFITTDISICLDNRFDKIMGKIK
ncbi:N-acetyltransferase [Porphyromonas pogonae]|uniref:N-acetyltransferase n=1 Tax=Porphyromonas pogonae TaxID=867595 RepID=UPI002E7A2FB8|nr:GNAT family N-acetyltransferase [Porphyromonas pogonae]